MSRKSLAHAALCAGTRRPDRLRLRAPSSLRQPCIYPQPPDEPRLQLLATYSASSDLGRRSPLRDFVVGKQQEKPIVKPYGFDIWQERIYVCDTALAALVVLDLERGRRCATSPARVQAGWSSRSTSPSTGTAPSTSPTPDAGR